MGEIAIPLREVATPREVEVKATHPSPGRPGLSPLEWAWRLRGPACWPGPKRRPHRNEPGSNPRDALVPPEDGFGRTRGEVLPGIHQATLSEYVGHAGLESCERNLGCTVFIHIVLRTKSRSPRVRIVSF